MTAVHLVACDHGSERDTRTTLHRRSFRARCGAAVGVAGIAAVLAVVDPAQRRVVPPCAFHAVTGLECPGCGMTRAVHELLNGNPIAALDLNPLFVLSLPVLAWWFGAWLLARPTNPIPIRVNPAHVWRWIAWMVAVVAVYGVLRNIDLSPLTYLAASP